MQRFAFGFAQPRCGTRASRKRQAIVSGIVAFENDHESTFGIARPAGVTKQRSIGGLPLRDR
jgi:hypothetical protein